MLSILPDAVVTNAETPVTINVLANDTGANLTITSFSKPAHGSLVFNGNTSFTYTPSTGFVGDDSFTYTVRDAQGTPASAEVTISVVPNAGTTVATDDVVEVIAGGSVIVPALANDMAADGEALKITAISMPGHGAVNVLSDQTIRYVPQSGFTGIDSFTYTVADGQGSSASATVTVKVLAKNSPPIAAADTFPVEAGQPTLLAVLANDSDPDGGPLQVVGFTMPSHGSLVFNPDRTFTYTSVAGFLGQDQFTYTIRDNRGASALAAVTLVVAEVTESPVAVDDQVTTEAGLPVTIDALANDTLPAGQEIAIVAVTLPFRGKLAFNPDKTITYTPNPGFVGIDDFTYTIGNGQGGTAKARVTVDVTPASIADVYANGYAYRRRLAIPASSARGHSHENFPLWVEFVGSWLKSTANGGKVVSVDGHDLRFELEGGTKLAHELEHYDAVAGKLGAWVRLPEFGADQPTVILLYYGKVGLDASEAEPQTVWQDYLAVWHLPLASDSSDQGRDLVAQGVVQTAPMGLGAGAISLAGDGVLKIDNASWLDGLDALTVQLRSKAVSIGHDRGLLGAGAGLFTGDSDVFIQYQAVGLGEGAPKNVVHSKIRTTAGDLLTSSAANAQTTDWQSAALTWQSGEPQSHLYLDGTQVQPSYKTQINAPGTTRIDGPLYAGSGPDDGESGGWTGLLDEVRLRPSQLSSSWIAAEHANYADPSAFYGIGAEDSLGDSSESLVAVPLSLSTPAGTRIDIDVLDAAVLPSGATGPLIESMSQPTHGTVSTIDDKIRYTPSAGFSGEDSFTYTLSLAGKTSTAKINIVLLAAPSDYVARVDALMPAAHYRMAEISGAVMVDRIAGKNGSWHNGPRLGIDPLVQDSAAGKSVGFKLADEPVHGRIKDLVQAASFTIDLALQLDRVPTPKYIVLTTGGGGTPGEFSLEIEADGQGGAWARFWSVASNGVPVVWRTGAGTVPVARAFKLSFRRDGGTGAIDLFVDGIILPKTLVQGGAPSSWPAVPARTWYLGEWPGSTSAPYGGLMAELVVWARAVAAAELQTLARVQNVVWLSDFDAGDVITSQSESIDLAPHAYPVAGITPTIVAPPALGTATIAGTTINYMAGNNVGADELTARVTANGVPSRNARIGITIAQISTGASDGWRSGWEGLSASPRGWLPDPLSPSSFGVNYRSWSSPPGYVNFGLQNYDGRNGIMYRQMDQGMPVFNADRNVSIGFPTGTMAVHLEWWANIDNSGRLIPGKRFGFRDVGGAGGGTVAGVDDTTTSGLGRPGGWSVRWMPRGTSSSELRVPSLHSFYTYCQNRRDFGAPTSGGKLYGVTFNTASGTVPLGQWVKLNWTITLNSPFQADGFMRFWVNGTEIFNRTGLLWQQDITKHPFHSFWWSWMWGGVPENFPPSSTWRERYGDFRIGVTSRANAVANPWPF